MIININQIIDAMVIMVLFEYRHLCNILKREVGT